MAEIVNGIPHRTAATGRPPRYDWPTLLDGQARKLTRGDFTGTPRDFGRQVRRAAQARHLDVEVITRSEPPTVWIQAKGKS